MKDSVITKLESLQERYEEVQALLGQPEVVADQERFKALSKEFASLTDVVKGFQSYKEAQSNYDGIIEMLNSDDAELRAMAEEEQDEAKANLEKVEHDIQILLLPKDPKDDNDCFLEIRAGTGGDEAAIFAGDLFRMYNYYAEKRGWQVEIVSCSEGEHGGYKEMIARLSGTSVYGVMKFESGGHRVQRVPETEAQGRVHTSACTVMVLPEVPEAEAPEINPADLRIDTYRSSGAGGQHINKTSSAIRITHLPTGIVVTCQNERSQFQNRDKAMQMLKAKLYMLRMEENKEKLSDIRGEVTEIGWGNQIRSYVFQPYTMVKDHRTGVESGNVDAVMDGAIDPFINGYLKWINTKPNEQA